MLCLPATQYLLQELNCLAPLAGLRAVQRREGLQHQIRKPRLRHPKFAASSDQLFMDGSYC